MNNKKEKYYLIGRTTVTQNRLDINEEELEAIKYANSIVSNILSVEQKYEIMILNYEEFEKTLLLMSLKETLRNTDYDNSDEFLMIICKSVANIILSIKIYVEQLKNRHLKKMIITSDLSSSIQSLLKSEITTSTEYRFIHKMRDYILHYDLPLNSVVVDSEFANSKTTRERRLGKVVIPYLHQEILLKDKKLKKEVLTSLSDSKGKIDLRIPIRKIISRISSFHIRLRVITDDALKRSESIITNTLNKYNAHYKTEISFGKAIRESHSSSTEEFYFALSDFERIKRFYIRNTEQGLLENIYIHNMIKL